MKYITAIATFLSLIACEKVIDVNLNDSDPKLIVEATLENNVQNNLVRLSRSVNFNEPNTMPAVVGANVEISAEQGPTYSLIEIEPGLYQYPDLIALEKDQYELNVYSEGETYLAKSSFLEPVTIDSLSYEYKEKSQFFDAGFRVTVYYTDPSDIGNYYRFKVYRKGILEKNIYVSDDQYSNGLSTSRVFFNLSFNKGEEVEVVLQHIDKGVYDYFNTLADLVNEQGGGSSAPSNPISNISNDALGYFGAMASDSKTITIQ